VLERKRSFHQNREIRIRSTDRQGTVFEGTHEIIQHRQCGVTAGNFLPYRDFHTFFLTSEMIQHNRVNVNELIQYNIGVPKSGRDERAVILVWP